MDANYKITDFGIGKPHPAQARFIRSTAPNVMFLGGRGSGKTTAGIIKTILACLDPKNAGLAFGLFAPTYRQLVRVHERELLRCLEAFKDRSGFSLLKRHYRSDHRYILRNNTEIFCQSFERVDRVRSLTLCGAYVDEIESDNEPWYTFGTLAAAVRGAGTLQVFTSTTPRGYRGVVRRFVDAVREGGEDAKDFHLVIAKTADNPYITDAYLQRLRASMSKAVFSQEVLARILRPAQTIFPEFQRARHVVPYMHDVNTPYSYGIDWGYSHPHVLCIAHHRGEGEQDRDIVCWEFCDDDIPDQQLIGIIKDHAKSMGRDPELIGADRAVPLQNQSMMRAFRSTRVRTMKAKADQDVWAGIERVRGLLDPIEGEPRLYFAESLLKKNRSRGIVKCMEQLRRKVKDGEVLDAVRKDNIHDHGVDGLAYYVKARYGRRGYSSSADSGGAGDIVERRMGQFGRR